MKRWMYGVRGVIRLDRIIRNKYIRSSLGIASIAKTIKKNRLWWFRHVKRRKEN